MTVTSLECLSDDLLLDITERLDTARDLAHFEATSRRARNLVHHNGGWRNFVRTSFPSLTIPSNGSTNWASVADRLTYLDRCWSKRGLYLTFIDEMPSYSGGNRRRRMQSQSVMFQSVMDAKLLSSLQEELLVYGAGENLLFRQRPTTHENTDSWRTLEGKDMNYLAGHGDVTAVSIIERGAAPEIVVGRANGDLQLLSAANDDTFGKPTQILDPYNADEGKPSPVPARASPGHKAISWTEWQHQSRMLATAKSSGLSLYNLDGTEEERLSPMLYYDISERGAVDESSLLRSIKFMSKDVIVCALGGSRQPLQWAKIRPTGLEFFNAAPNSQALRDIELGPASRPNDKTTVRAIAPVGAGNDHLILSAWDDGSHRLSDLRTPSQHDALYRDRFQPYQGSSSLLVYGSERFVAGNNWGPEIRFFDFRFSKPYHHFNGLSCSGTAPAPRRPHPLSKSSETKGVTSSTAAACNHTNSTPCVWHGLSGDDSWRPDAVLNVGGSHLDRVHSMAKASDLSTSFYCGFRGAIVELTLSLSEDANRENQSRTAAQGWRANAPRGKVSLMEIGVGRSDEEAWMDDYTGLPEMFYHKQRLVHDDSRDPQIKMKTNGSRLDTAFSSVRERKDY